MESNYNSLNKADCEGQTHLASTSRHGSPPSPRPHLPPTPTPALTHTQTYKCEFSWEVGEQDLLHFLFVAMNHKPCYK